MQTIENFRDYLSALKSQGQLHEIDREVDCDLELGAIMKKNNRQKGPALLFKKLSGFPDGFRAFGSPVNAWGKPGMTYSRIATSMGIDPETNVLEIIDRLSKIVDLPRVKPTVVVDAPCKENKMLGDEVDLTKLPAPMLHEGDGGNYIGTWHIVVTENFDRSWTNWGMYRTMVHDKKTMGAPLIPTQHIGMQYATWKEAGKPMPFAMAFGVDPLSPLIASMAIPKDVSEVDVVGAYRGKPLEQVRCETVDLCVPASAEIVIEGYVSLDEARTEGPFTEYTGFLIKSAKDWPVFNVTAITYRNNPILPVVCTGEPVEDHLCMSVSLAAGALDLLRKAKLPVLATFIPASSALHHLIVKVDKDRFEGTDRELVEAVAKVIWSDKVGSFSPKILLVDSDIDITDTEIMLWCSSTRCHPGRGIHLFPDTTVVPLQPYLLSDEKKAAKTTNVVYDCTWSKDVPKEKRPIRATYEALWPKEIQQKVDENWTSDGFDVPYQGQESYLSGRE